MVAKTISSAYLKREKSLLLGLHCILFMYIENSRGIAHISEGHLYSVQEITVNTDTLGLIPQEFPHQKCKTAAHIQATKAL